MGVNSWHNFFALYEKAEKRIKLLVSETNEFIKKTGANIEVVIKRFKEDARESEHYIERLRGKPVMEVSIIGKGLLAEELICLIGEDFPLRGNNPKEIAEKFASIFGEAMEIIKKELHI